jgi:hypothetical protein
LAAYAVGWRVRRDDLAVFWRLLHRQKVAFTGAHNVDGNTHAVGDGLSVAVSFLFGHDVGSSCPPPAILVNGSLREQYLLVAMERNPRLLGPHLGRDPGYGRIACADEASRLPDARAGRERNAYGSLPFWR